MDYSPEEKGITWGIESLKNAKEGGNLEALYHAARVILGARVWFSVESIERVAFLTDGHISPDEILKDHVNHVALDEAELIAFHARVCIDSPEDMEFLFK
jgi:hypothetical protein